MSKRIIDMVMEKDYKSLNETVNDKLCERVASKIDSEKKLFIESLKAAKSKKE